MNVILALVVISCVFLLGSSRMRTSIRVTALQGVALGALPLLVGEDHLFHSSVWLLSLGGMILKGGLLPWLLMTALVRSRAKREIEPFVGFSASLLIGLGLLGLSALVALRLGRDSALIAPQLLAVALFLVLTGLFLIISRRKAITQTLGYLVMENGIFAAGIGLGHEFPLLVEMGVMLDVFVGVFLMGIMLFHIDHEFDHIDADRLTELRDSHPREFSPERAAGGN
jgi:hydrogenase-4 component E